jgi:hypothetical protein
MRNALERQDAKTLNCKISFCRDKKGLMDNYQQEKSVLLVSFSKVF